jgi:anti-anti-sigma factor
MFLGGRTMETAQIPADLHSRGVPMNTLDRTPPSPDEPEAPAAASLRPGTVHRLGKRTTVRLATRGAAPVTVRVAGEIDLACADELTTLLRTALDAYPQGMELDLAEIGFCDCCGLTALLTTRACARRLGRHFALGPHSPNVARLLKLTGARAALTTPD